mgnify:CR=1 FL=1
MRYIALNGWIYCGFGGEKSPREFIDWAAEKGLDGIELTVGDCLSADTTEAEAKELAAYAKSKGVGLRSLATGAGWGKWLCSDDPAEMLNLQKMGAHGILTNKAHLMCANRP